MRIKSAKPFQRVWDRFPIIIERLITIDSMFNPHKMAGCFSLSIIKGKVKNKFNKMVITSERSKTRLENNSYI